MKKILSIFLFTIISLTILNSFLMASLRDEDLLVNDDRIFVLANKYTAMLSELYREEAAGIGVNVYEDDINVRNQRNEIKKVKALTSLMQTIEDIKPKSLSTYAQADYYTMKELINLRYYNTKIKNQFELDPMWYLQPMDTTYVMLLKSSLLEQDRLNYVLKLLSSMPDILHRAENNLTNPSDLSVKLTIERLNLELANIKNLTDLMIQISDGTKTMKEQINSIAYQTEKVLKNYKNFLQNKLKTKQYSDFRIGTENYKYLFQKVYQLPYKYGKLESILKKNMDLAEQHLLDAIAPKVLVTLTDEQKEERTIEGKILILPGDYNLIAKQYKDAPAHDKILANLSKQLTESNQFFEENKIFPSLSLPITIAPAPIVFKDNPYKIKVFPPVPLAEKQTGEILVTLPKKVNLNKEEYTLNYNYAKIKLNAAEFILPGLTLIYSVPPVNISLPHNMSNDIFYINGWVKYALDTAYENDFFSTDEEKITYLWSDYKKAVYAMVDYKLQTQDLDLDSALTYIKEAGIEESEAEDYLNYLALNPLDAVSYVLGSQEFYRLRTKYKKQLGKDFDLQTFHTKVLSLGRIPLLALEKSLEKAYAAKEIDSYFSMTYY